MRRTAVAALVLAGMLPAAGSAGAGARAAFEPCRAHVSRRVLPPWARGGFSEARPRMPFELGRRGRIAAILFAVPLVAPPPRDHANKILWVSRVPRRPGSDLRITARRMTGARPVGLPVRRRVVGGPGPSIVDLPAAGCWRLTLRWSGWTDTLDLAYVARP